MIDTSPAPLAGSGRTGGFLKVHRILISRDYRRVFQGGRCLKLGCVRVHVLESPREISRLGLVVSRKVGNAVTRNRVKRRLRDLFRRHQEAFPRPLDVVVVANHHRGPAEYSEYARAFEELLARLGEAPGGES